MTSISLHIKFINIRLRLPLSRAPAGVSCVRSQRLIVFFGLAFIAVAVFFVVTSLQHADAEEGTPPVVLGNYQGADSCQSCHQGEYDGWSGTSHAQVFQPGSAFYESFISRGAPDTCQPCHTVGYGQPGTGGYDPSLPWNDSYNVPRLGIQCENCHGADPMSLPAGQQYNTASEVCAQCHSGSRRPQFSEWNASAHASSVPPYVQNLACAECHEAKLAGEYLSTGEAPTALPPDPRWQLTCSTCHDPHDGTNEANLRRPANEICAPCHTSEGAVPGEAVHHSQAEMRDGTAAIPVPSSQSMSAVYCVQCHMYSYPYNASLTPPAMAGHGFEPRPEACVSCHDGTSGFLMTPEQAETAIDGWQEATRARLESARAALEDADAAIDAADDYGFDPTTIGQAAMYYDQANYSANFVEGDGSMGAHNFDYAANLLAYADLKAGQVVAMLTPGTLSGTVFDADGNPVAGVELWRAGKLWATSGPDGRFSFAHAPGSFTFALMKDGNEVGTLDATIFAGQTSDVRAALAPPTVPAAASTEGLQYVTLLLMLIAILLLIALIVRRRAQPAAVKPATTSPETVVYEEEK